MDSFRRLTMLSVDKFWTVSTRHGPPLTAMKRKIF